MRLIDVLNQRFGRLVVQQRIVGKWRCLCDCGNVKDARGCDLQSGQIRSCGCLHREVCGNLHRSHGHSVNWEHTPTYHSWHAMKQRCLNPNSTHYNRYGGRGITVCNRWKYFLNFLHDMGERPEGKELSRIDEAQGYEPGNVVWETHLENTQRRDSSMCGPHRKV